MKFKPSDELSWEDEVTKVDHPGGWKPIRARKPGDELIERITLERPPGGTSIQFSGSDALKEACLMLDAWATKTRRKELAEVGFAIHFGDGLIYDGRVNIHQKKSRDLALRLRDPESFRAALCPSASPEEAAQKFELFASYYSIGIPLSRARRIAQFLRESLTAHAA